MKTNISIELTDEERLNLGKKYQKLNILNPHDFLIMKRINRFVEVNNLKLGCTALAQNPYLLSEAILKLFNTSRSERELMGIRARRCAEKYYSRFKLNKRCIDIINKYIK